MPTRRQKVDATTSLRLTDPKIHIEAALLEKLRSAAMRGRANTAVRSRLKKASSLYINYRGTGFPLRTRANRIPPQWRSLSAWMKLQIGGLCLGEHVFQQFRITPTQGLMDRMESVEGIKDYPRDDLRRRLRRTFGREPWFFFAIEDRSVDGDPVAPHIHGSIRVYPMPLPLTAGGAIRAKWARIAARDGNRVAEIAYGRLLVRLLIRQAPGPGSMPHSSWSRKPILRRSNPDWISYALKNMDAPSIDLPDRRMVISRPLTQEATRLWELIRRGEPALTQWNRIAP